MLLVRGSRGLPGSGWVGGHSRGPSCKRGASHSWLQQRVGRPRRSTRWRNGICRQPSEAPQQAARPDKPARRGGPGRQCRGPRRRDRCGFRAGDRTRPGDGLPGALGRNAVANVIAAFIETIPSGVAGLVEPAECDPGSRRHAGVIRLARRSGVGPDPGGVRSGVQRSRRHGPTGGRNACSSRSSPPFRAVGRAFPSPSRRRGTTRTLVSASTSSPRRIWAARPPETGPVRQV